LQYTRENATLSDGEIFAQPFAANFGEIFAPDAVALHLYQVRDYASLQA
jgi:hypothetical protein